MELTVYRQAYKQRPDGTIVYKGEDALPFVNEQVLFVADGLGGVSSIRHKSIVPEMFDPDKLPEILLGEPVGQHPHTDLVRYVKDSFFELFAVKNCYTDNINNIKKSGYFASRIVALILLDEFIYSKNPYPVDAWIRHLERLSESERAEVLEGAGELWAKLIRDNLRRIADRAHLIYESAVSGLSLLGSTVTMTLFRETTDRVQAVYLTAGDSRPYYWSETDGLCQILPDEERADGRMTNYIRANEDSTFRINCHYVVLPKPCILFNATDGCFDSKYFLSPMAFEKLLLETATECDSPHDMGIRLEEIFKDYGKHDDSSTIAMKMFGYDDFAAVKSSAQARLDVIRAKYLSKLPDLLDKDRSQTDAAEERPETEVLKAYLQETLFENYLYGYRRYMAEDPVHPTDGSAAAKR